MSDRLTIRSHKGPYSAIFDSTILSDSGRLAVGDVHFLVDANVARLYARPLRPVLSHPHALTIEATEKAKSFTDLAPVIERLVRDQTRRGHALIAIGGGIVQDITCFIASVLLRGVEWRFVPTTLLAQADSCIGSKSSVNLGKAKNILGTFYPPTEVLIDVNFLDTLEEREIRSGIGEIIKVHAIDGARTLDRLATDFDALATDRTLLLKYIRSALEIKRRFIEEDEFDRGIRNIFNYGHSFGHAIESATDYAVPHGIAVTMGMDMANGIAVMRGLLPVEQDRRMRPLLRKNYAPFGGVPISVDALLSALTKDKKNAGTTLGLILPVGDGAEIRRMQVAPDDAFREQCVRALSRIGE